MEKKIYVFVLLAIFLLLAATSMRINSATNDEVAHIPAGYSYWKYFDYKLNPEHPPLIKLWATIPLLIINPTLPSEELWQGGEEWEFGKGFLYWSGNDADQLYFWSRLMIVFIGILLGYYVYRWAAELYGWKAGLLALVFYVFDPNIIANSTIVHTDIPISAGIFILVYYFWKYTKKKVEAEIVDKDSGQKLGWKQLTVLGILIGLCFAIKFTGIYVIFFLIILYFVHLYFDIYIKQNYMEQKNIISTLHGFYIYLKGKEGKHKLVNGIYALGILIIIGILILAATYGFANIKYYFIGFNDVVLHSTGGHQAYLLGMNSQTGWWYYFIIAFFVKTPIATLILLFTSFFLFCKKIKTSGFIQNIPIKNELFLLIPSGLYFISFMLNNINIGLRHILPIYPFLFVFMSSILAVENFAKSNFLTNDAKFSVDLNKYKNYGAYIIGVLVAWLVIANIFAYPYYLAYFNEFIGGPKNGYKYLLDSNIDWGQGLKETAQWLRDNDYLNQTNQTIRMTYFGKEEPAYRGITFKNITCAPTPGIHVISVNRLYDFMGNQYGCVEWLKKYEPIAIIGYSIFIYNINEPEVIENYNKCMQDCKEGCLSRGKMYGDSIYKDTTEKCICICEEASNEELGII